MAEVAPESPFTAQDEGDENPDSLAGEEVLYAEHDLNLAEFDEESEEEQ